MRSYLATGAFWAGALERVARTIAQVLLSFLAVDSTANVVGNGRDVFNLDWKYAFAVALTSGLASLLMSVAGGPIGPPGSPSFVNDRPVPAKASDASV
jgi:hypothetical protein